MQQWIGELATEGLAAGTIRHHYIALKKLFKWAARERIVTIDPCAHVTLPRAEAGHSYPILTLTEIERVAEALEETPPYGLLVRFLAQTGLRMGEAAGLRVGDVELAARRLFVRQTAQRIKGKWVFGTPKSSRSTREVPLLNSKLVADLKSYLMMHPKSGQPDALFWPGRAPGSREVDYDRILDGSTFLRSHLKPALTRAGLSKMRNHDLRHTAASMWLDMGIPPYKVSRWLGHANIATTDGIYAHLYSTDYSDDVAKFEKYEAAALRKSS